MAELQGSAKKRLDDLAAMHEPSPEWLLPELVAALEEIAMIEPIADEESERREDF